MLELISSQVLAFQKFILFFLAMAIIIVIAHVILCLNVKISSKRIGYLGLFYQLSRSEAWVLGAIYIRLIFVIWSIKESNIYGIMEFLFYGILSVIIIVYILIRKGGVADLIGTILIGISIFTGNLLLEYNRQMANEKAIDFVYWALALFTVLYTVYITVKAVGKLSKIRRIVDDKLEIQ